MVKEEDLKNECLNPVRMALVFLSLPRQGCVPRCSQVVVLVADEQLRSLFCLPLFHCLWPSLSHALMVILVPAFATEAREQYVFTLPVEELLLNITWTWGKRKINAAKEAPGLSCT